ncbi:MAG: hypothetical protein M1536_04775 [Firmicutes bacterium]|nr:hypothetical protein [Bacillota bacterium]
MENKKFLPEKQGFSYERDILEPAKRGGASEFTILSEILNAAKRENILPEDATLDDLRGQITDILRQFAYKGLTKIKLLNGEIKLGYIPPSPGTAPNFMPKPPVTDPRQEFENGIIHYRKGDLSKASSCFSRALSYFQKMGLEEEKLRCREFLVRINNIPLLFPFDKEQLLRKMAEEIDKF